MYPAPPPPVCTPQVARAALGCDRATDAEGERALADALLEGARVALGRLGRGGDTTKRILGGGVVRCTSHNAQPSPACLTASHDQARKLAFTFERLLASP